MENTPQTISLDDIITFVNNEDKISDIHVAWWEYITFRYNWEIVKQEQYGKLSDETIKQMVLTSMKSDQNAFQKFVQSKDEDYSYISREWIPYRVNAFWRLGKMALIMRKINGKALPMDILMFPDMVDTLKNQILSRKKWLYLVTWPTGSGKSTSLVAMLEFLNQTRSEHIITMEDPIEFIFEPKWCAISQRNIWLDSVGFHTAIKAAMREDPDIMLIWEIRDQITAEAALNMAETWHFVFATLHTSSAPATINRYISFFPPEIQDSVCDRLSTALAGVQSQMLVKSTDGRRCGVYELMINTVAVRNNIKKREIPQLTNIIETGKWQGMMTMKQYAERLIESGKVIPENLAFIFSEEAK